MEILEKKREMKKKNRNRNENAFNGLISRMDMTERKKSLS